MVQIIRSFQNASAKTQALLSALSFGLYMISSHFLEVSYAQSRFPVPYFVQQTSFDATKIKAWYGFMISEGTFRIYLTTQLIDFLFIATVILAGFSIWTLIASRFPKDSTMRTCGLSLAFSLPLAGGFDIMENLVSFFMIANPVHFPDSLVYVYSSFASLKFACWMVGLIWLIVSLVALMISKLWGLKRQSTVGLNSRV